MVEAFFEDFQGFLLNLCQDYFLLLWKKVDNLDLRPQGVAKQVAYFFNHFEASALSNSVAYKKCVLDVRWPLRLNAYFKFTNFMRT